MSLECFKIIYPSNKYKPLKSIKNNNIDYINPEYKESNSESNLPNFITAENVNNYDFNKSKIYNCVIQDKEFKKIDLKTVLKEVYKSINDKYKIINSSTLNTLLGKPKKFSGYTYIKNLEISVCFTKDNNNIMREIIKQVITHDVQIKLSINVEKINNT